MNTVGRKTADRMMAMATTGPETSSIAFKRRVFRRHSFLDVMFHRFDHDDGIVHHQPDGEHQAKERQRVDGKAQQRENGERANQRHRNRQQRDQRRPPALQEDEDHQHHQRQRFPERLADLTDSLGDRLGGVDGDLVIQVRRETALSIRP